MNNFWKQYIPIEWVYLPFIHVLIKLWSHLQSLKSCQKEAKYFSYSLDWSKSNKKELLVDFYTLFENSIQIIETSLTVTK